VTHFTNPPATPAVIQGTCEIIFRRARHRGETPTRYPDERRPLRREARERAMERRILRTARTGDLGALLAMQAEAMRVLGRGHYEPDVIEAALIHMGTMDPALVEDGAYFVAELDGRIAGSAGWSVKAPSYASLMDDPPGPLVGWPAPVATVRSVFVHPACAQLGIATTLMRHVEGAMRASGIAVADLMATLSGVPLYRARGYRALAPYAVNLPEGRRLAVRRMAKGLVERPPLVVAA
jgi:GNAT superfamily N-acetyltransferase